jgi:hypothetical protein
MAPHLAGSDASPWANGIEPNGIWLEGGSLLLATSVRWRVSARMLSVALLGGMTLSSALQVPVEAVPAPDASGTHAVPAGVSSAGALRAARQVVAQRHVRNTHHVVEHRSTYQRTTGGSGTSSVTSVQAGPGGISQWAIPPGHPAWSLGDFAGDIYASAYGGCTWWAWYRHRNLPVLQLGMASTWASRARALGLPVGTSAAAGATVVFAPGVQGAGSDGHVGVVESVLGNGWFLLSEMNFYFNGGGWGRISYRYAHVGAGVSFIY